MHFVERLNGNLIIDLKKSREMTQGYFSLILKFLKAKETEIKINK